MPVAAVDGEKVERFRADLERLLHAEGPVSPASRLGIALSGGPDSCALLLLAAAVAPGRVTALTVDHGLRPESADEALRASAIAAAVGVPHATVRVEVERSSSVQAAARTARYKALARWAEAEEVAAVLTGHHADDQAETLLMRLARGAGVGGLAGVRACRPLSGCPDGVALVRPLLGWRRAELEAIVAVAGIDPVRDPSNHDDRYDRTAARRFLAETPWLDVARLCRSAANLADADDLLESIARDAYAEAVRREGDTVILSGAHHRETLRRLVVRIFAEEFGKRPDGPALDPLFAPQPIGAPFAIADTLCTVRLTTEGPEWRFRRAPPRRSG